jgi:hypothetical protein
MKKFNPAIKRKKTSEEVEDITDETVKRKKTEGIYFR